METIPRWNLMFGASLHFPGTIRRSSVAAASSYLPSHFLPPLMSSRPCRGPAPCHWPAADIIKPSVADGLVVGETLGEGPALTSM